jgi:hypothetical protein
MTESPYDDQIDESEPEDSGDDLDPSDDLTGDQEEPSDTGYSPPDFEPKASRYGTTELEESEGESLDQLLSEEEPDISVDDLSDDPADPRAGRLVAPDEGAHPDEESDEIATDVGTAGYAASAEEAAVHIIDDDE